ncbi:hypothetical protein H6G54_06990 [Anabaena cylindrica FACHB-243]|uniref:Uncharacterized protein n=1 Tax=Anabaena cylindrica (strain ATCC 27899 / PCC 7122) TaxID=272123 RepID=K9ZBZ0_ANACC|nr:MULTISPECIES: hypothetical protein [Anabaena]AFZ56229.1 hypothetical protein Anacy_0637 [Anabaena cylindrica PCC 7122]MBD2417456.1 hypothetical protein [Anabaena cylindrica FACHB-243]MBY5285786.1 hypothetical protein [Anabaena sp. CCAP 1446/1C]MBY5311759.1 hypothetical protein [Anabaena sp. CCAP 1446/1C]MCM2407625.1 hypothetical protein [Anabaena sp. CCAP 1446/1C]
MVRYALNKDSIFVDAQCNLYDKNEIFKCIFCNCQLFYKKAHHKARKETPFWVSAHFSHNANIEENKETGIDCISNKFVSSKGESSTHREAKNEATDVIKATTEIYFKQDKFQPIQEYQYPGRRADIAVINKKGTGFLNYEIQTSPTGFDSIIKRVDKDRINHVGQTIYAIGEISKKGDWGKGVGGLSATQGTLLDSCIRQYGIAQDIQTVVTQIERITFLDKRTGFTYTDDKNLEQYIQFNQYNEKNGQKKISNVTTDTTAEVIHEAILEHEKLMKNTKIFDMGSTSNSSVLSIDDISDEFNDEDTDKYETSVSELDFKLLNNLKLVCQTNQGHIGAAIEFNIHIQKAKTVLLGERVDSYQWIDFEDLYISKADFTSTTNSYQKTNLEEQQENSSYLEIINKEIITIDILNAIKDFNQEIASKVQRVKIGDYCTWKNAPNWWNPNGEKINDIKDGKVRLDIFSERKYIPIEEVIRIESVE